MHARVLFPFFPFFPKFPFFPLLPEFLVYQLYLVYQLLLEILENLEGLFHLEGLEPLDFLEPLVNPVVLSALVDQYHLEIQCFQLHLVRLQHLVRPDARDPLPVHLRGILLPNHGGTDGPSPELRPARHGGGDEPAPGPAGIRAPGWR